MQSIFTLVLFDQVLFLGCYSLLKLIKHCAMMST